MKELSYILLLFFFIFQTDIKASTKNEQPNDITISLQVSVALRIPHNTIIININKVNDRYLLQTDTKPLEGYSSDNYPEFHNSKTFPEKWYEDFSKYKFILCAADIDPETLMPKEN